MAYLSVESIVAGYEEKPVLNAFSLSIEQGEFLAVVGPNGSGKSTLVKAVSGSLGLRSGAIYLDGRPLSGMSARERARQVAVVSQSETTLFDFTVEESVRMGRLPHLRPFRGETAHDLALVQQALSRTDTLHLAGRPVTRLSGGERQRVLIARALAQEPRLLILDEPTAYLDIAHQVELLDLVRRLNRSEGLTIVAVLHDLNLAAQYAGRLLLMRDGLPVATGTPAEVITEANVAAVYGSRVRVMEHPEEPAPHVFLLSGDSRWDH